MKLLFYIAMFGFMLFLNFGLYLPSIFAVDEEDIGKNTNRLKSYQWFREMLNDQAYNQLIVHDKDVRKTIGKFNSKKMDKKLFQNRYRKKLQSVLDQKTGTFA